MTVVRERPILRTAVIGVSRVVSIVGILAMAAMVVHVTVDVVCRLFEITLPGTVAFVANYYMLFVTFLPLVVVERERSHIEVEVVAQTLAPGAQASLRLFAWTLTACVLGFLGWEASQEALRAHRASMFIIEQSIRFDTWIPYFALPVGYFLAAAVAASRVALVLVRLHEGIAPAVSRAEAYYAERANP